MLNPISFILCSTFLSFIRVTRKLPWKAFAFVLLIHLGVLWWLLGGYFGQTSDIFPEPIFVMLESVEALPPEISLQSLTDEPAQADTQGKSIEEVK